MNAAPEEKFCIEDVSSETITEADDDVVMKISDRLLEQHMQAYTALANA